MPSSRIIPAFVFVLALAVILGAWGFQLIGGYIPCKLCLEERVPYYVGIPLALVALVSSFFPRLAWLTRLALGLAAIVFAWGFYLGTYHAGVEWHWWAGPSDCTAGGGGNAMSTGDLLSQLDNIRVVPCDQATWRFPAGWGLSFAGWNAVMSLVLAVAAAIGAMRLWPRPQGSSSLSQ